MDLSWIQWKAEEMTAAAEAALRVKKEKLNTIKVVPVNERTFENTIAALERADDDLADLQQRFEMLAAVHPDAKIRDAAQQTAQRIETENIALAYDRELWRAVQEWSSVREPLDAADTKLADDIIRDMRRMGFDLPDEKFERLKTVEQELKILESEFEKTINDYQDHILVTREQLDGLSESYIAGLTKDADGKYIVSLQYPDLFPFMQYAHDDTSRRELAHKNYRKGGMANLERLAHMIRLRQEHAALLGYASHADYVTEVRMAGNGTTVQKFLDGLLAKLASAVHRDMRDLVDIKKETTDAKPAPIHTHEIAYWSNVLRKKRYNLDSEEVRQYLPTNHVMAGILDIYQSILGLRFSPVVDAVLWHPDAKLYEVADVRSGASLGYFALDLYPRTGKYGHASAMPIGLSRQRTDGSQTPGMVALVCNFPRPTPTMPSLLSRDETETLFHEFGHVMHALVSGGRYQRQNGFGVAMDFMEALSQIFEYWAWDSRVLARITRHHITGEAMPQELIDKLLASRRHLEGIYYNHQALQALYDLWMHSQPTDTSVSAHALAQKHRDMELQYAHQDLPDDAILAAGWDHMADYDAGYYGYLWSKAYAADMFTRFESDPLNPIIGADYRTKVLAPGASRPERSLVEDFLSRPSNSDAFFKELGIQ